MRQQNKNRIYDPENLIESYSKLMGKSIFYLSEGEIQEIDLPPQTKDSQLEKIAVKAEEK